MDIIIAIGCKLDVKMASEQFLSYAEPTFDQMSP